MNNFNSVETNFYLNLIISIVETFTNRSDPVNTGNM